MNFRSRHLRQDSLCWSEQSEIEDPVSQGAVCAELICHLELCGPETSSMTRKVKRNPLAGLDTLPGATPITVEY